MMEQRVRVQCSGKDDMELMVARVRDAEQRWPDQEFDQTVGRQLLDGMQYASDCFDLIDFGWPTIGPVAGDDYIDVIGHVLRRAEVEAPVVTVKVGNSRQAATRISDSTWGERMLSGLASASAL